MTNSIEMSVWDYNRLQKNERVGSVVLDLREIKRYGSVGPMWLPIYGAPDGVSRGNDVKVMNKNPHLASNYRGRLLVELSHEKDEERQLPEKATVQKLQKKLPWQLSPPMRKPQLTMKAMVLSGDSIPKSRALPFSSKEYRIAIECGGQMCVTYPVRLGKDLQAHWYQVLQMNLELPSAPDDNWERKILPDTFIYLCRGDPYVDKNRICYSRVPTLQLIETGFDDASIQWVPLTGDPVIDQVRDVTDPGTVLMKLAVGQASEVDQRTGDWELEMEEATETYEYQLRLHCYQASDLPAVNENGSIDPFIKASLCGVETETKYITQCNNPQWYETLTMNVALPAFRFAPQVKVQLWDKQYLGSQYVSEARFALSTKLGRNNVTRNSKLSGPYGSFGGIEDMFEEKEEDDSTNASEDDPFQYTPVLDISDVSSMRPQLLDPHWYGLARRGVFGGRTQGSVLLGFQLIRKSHHNEIVPNIPRSIAPITEEWLVEIVVLGLRDMAPYKFLPPNNPQVSFDVGKRERKGDTKRTQHSKKPSGTNPNYFQRLLVPINIPLNPLFAPSLGISVEDSRFGGLWKPTLGTASVHLSPKIPWSPDYDAKTVFKQQQKLQAAAKSLYEFEDVSDAESMSDDDKDTGDTDAKDGKGDSGAGTGLALEDEEPKQITEDHVSADGKSEAGSVGSSRSYDPSKGLVKADGAVGEKDEDVQAYMRVCSLFIFDMRKQCLNTLNAAAETSYLRY